MRKQYSRIAAVVLALTAGGLAAFALKPASGNSAATLAARNPAVEVRTQVIRRTIHVIRHEPGAKLHGARGRSVLVGAPSSHGRARTAASGGHHSTHSAATGFAVATRSSGSHTTASASAPASQSHPVTTRSSGSHTTASASAPASQSHPVTTRSSGSHGTSSGSGSAGSPGHPVTRSSGGGHGHGDDGGNDGGRDD